MSYRKFKSLSGLVMLIEIGISMQKMIQITGKIIRRIFYLLTSNLDGYKRQDVSDVSTSRLSLFL